MNIQCGGRLILSGMSAAGHLCQRAKPDEWKFFDGENASTGESLSGHRYSLMSTNIHLHSQNQCVTTYNTNFFSFLSGICFCPVNKVVSTYPCGDLSAVKRGLHLDSVQRCCNQIYPLHHFFIHYLLACMCVFVEKKKKLNIFSFSSCAPNGFLRCALKQVYGNIQAVQ